MVDDGHFDISPMTSPARSQYAKDSAPNQNFNCGPTTIVNAVRYMRDKAFPIEETRNLGTSRNGTGTFISERKVMMEKRGVPCSAMHLDPSAVKNILDGRHAIDIALNMGKIPLKIRRRPFDGGHSVEGLAVGVATCPVHGKREPGIYVNNPDFHPDRGEPSRYFYPDHAWIPAYLAMGGWCVVPDKPKDTRDPYRAKCVTTSGVNLRSGPSRKHSIVKVESAGFAFTSIQLERAGGAYLVAGKSRRDWLSLNLGGRLVWVARGHTREV